MVDKLNLQNIVQIAYYVNDVEAAARKAHAAFGTGPFFIYKNIELLDVSYRGQKSELDHSSAYAQTGSLMIEFTQQNNNAPSAFTDMYPNHEEGFHHVAIFVEDIAEEMLRLSALGCETVTHYFTREGNVEVAFIDTRSILGHMVEIYKPVDALTRFYSAVAKSVENWDGKELFRYIN
jgi:glyoxalase/bleomycin resistance protein/dioxygenase superfamily protein